MDKEKHYIKKGWGYWDVTVLPYGGKFVRAEEHTRCEIIAGNVKFSDEKRIRFDDGTEGICKTGALNLLKSE